MTERLIVGVYGSARLPESDPRWVAAKGRDIGLNPLQSRDLIGAKRRHLASRQADHLLGRRRKRAAHFEAADVAGEDSTAE